MRLVWVAASLLAFSGGALADWQAVRFGMKLPEVIAAGSGKITKVDEIKDKRIKDQRRLATGSAEIDGVSYSLDFFFKPRTGELSLINHVPDKTACDTAITSHIRRFGEGTVERKSTVIQPGKPPLATAKYVWNDPASGDRIEGSDVAVAEYDIRYCQFLHMK